MGTMRALRVAIVGSGPSGFYAAETLLAQKHMAVCVDMFDRLPTPYGLVRYGVAPDHQKIKSVIQFYERIALQPSFRFFGNVQFGRDIFAEDLHRHYDQVVYAVGCESDRRLDIPGEDLKGIHSATTFVGWYNGHPDCQKETFDLSQESVAVIGIGNVAMDVVRILAQNPERLAQTDIAGDALEALRRSRVKEIFLLGRRGPAQAAFSPTEIREIAQLDGADLVLRPEELTLDEASKANLASVGIQAKKNLDFLREHAGRGEGNGLRKVRLRFCVSPVEILGEGGQARAIRIERNRLVENARGEIKAEGTAKFETFPAGLVFRSVGYLGIPLPGVPFDSRKGHIPNEKGRILKPLTGKIVEGAYAVGWAKRGPTGLIGTNRADSAETVKSMLEDIAGRRTAAKPEKSPEAMPDFLLSRKIQFVTFEDWKRLDRLELERGSKLGKVREKFTDISQMLLVLQAEENKIAPATSGMVDQCPQPP